MTRRGIYRGVYSSLIDDPDFQCLSSEARHCLLTMRLSAQAGAAGIFPVYAGALAVQTGLEVTVVEKALDELATSPNSERPWIYRERGIVWVRNALRYDPNLRLADPKHRKSVERAVAALPRLEIVGSFCRYYQIASPFDDPAETLAGPFEDQSSPRPSPRPSPRKRPRKRPSPSPTPTVGSPNGLGQHADNFVDEGIIEETDLP